MNERIISVLVALGLAFTLAGCSGSSAGSKTESSASNSNSQPSEGKTQQTDESNAAEENSSSKSYTGGWGLVSDDLIEQFVERYDEFESAAIEELENRKNATPVHAALGEEVEATGNLAVSVLSVEPGPYDYADNTPTVKVTVAMRNLTDKAITVKASNWDADNGNGQRVDHKLFIKDERGKRDVRSFEPTKVSPNATFTGVVYFDGENLNSVIYEPHWLVSSQNQYIYFDL